MLSPANVNVFQLGFDRGGANGHERPLSKSCREISMLFASGGSHGRSTRSRRRPGILPCRSIRSVKTRPGDCEFLSAATLWPIVEAARANEWAALTALGGILAGVFTPTEAAAVSVLYAFVVGHFVYRELGWRQLPALMQESLVVTAVIMFIIANAAIFGWLVAALQMPQEIIALITGNVGNRWMILQLSIFFSYWLAPLWRPPPR